MGEDDYDDYSKELNQYKKSKDRGRGEFGPLWSSSLVFVCFFSFCVSFSHLCLTAFICSALKWTHILPLLSASGGKGLRGRGRGKGGRGMIRGGKGRNRGRGRGDMGNDDDNNGDMDNGVRTL